MTEISYDHLPWPVREEVAQAHRRQWARLAEPGTWLTGAERVAVAAEARHALSCELCRARKAALSPFAVDGEHDSLGQLPAVMVEQIHRIRTDPGRLSRAWYDGVIAEGVRPERYVETVGVVVHTVAVDTFCRGLGIELWPLPDPVDGAPSRLRPPAEPDIAWVPTLNPADVAGTEWDNFYGGRPAAAHIHQAMSLVPAEVRGFFDLATVQYLSSREMRDFDNEFRAISHDQIELVAGRVSALNQCVY